MEFAIIKTGGKQYLVSPKQKLKIEKLEKGDNEQVIFDQVLLLEKDSKLEIGTPFLKGAKVSAKVLRQGKADKVYTMKFKAKKREKTKKGHRQPFTEIEIEKISN